MLAFPSSIKPGSVFLLFLRKIWRRKSNRRWRKAMRTVTCGEMQPVTESPNRYHGSSLITVRHGELIALAVVNGILAVFAAKITGFFEGHLKSPARFRMASSGVEASQPNQPSSSASQEILQGLGGILVFLRSPMLACGCVGSNDDELRRPVFDG